MRMKPQTDRVLSVEDLLALHDEEFVQCAYRLLLGREPDPDGLESYLRQVRAGADKSTLALALATSREGRARQSTIKGLDELQRRSRPPRFIFLRKVTRSLLSGALAPVETRLRVLENQLYLVNRKLDQGPRDPSGLALSYAADSSPPRGNPTGVARIRPPVSPRPRRFFPRRRIVLNVSTSKHWRSHPVGIVRVERELAKQMFLFADAEFIYWNGQVGAFHSLDEESVDTILSDAWCEPGLHPELSRDVHTGRPFLPEASDTIISIGLDWDLSPTHQIYRATKDTGCQIVLGCYDLVPVIYPEFSARADIEDLFQQHVADIAHTATRVFAISTNTKQDLEDFWRRADIKPKLPPVDVIPLASMAVPHELPSLSEHDAGRLRHIRAQGDYIVYVSTLEARKNHRLAINLWRQLFHERGRECPQLVLVGRRGWGCDDLIAQMERMPATLAGKIIWLDEVNDSLLQHLYKHCLFSLFPSYYEGWGLSANEALAFGKVCVVANNSALPEATQNTMPSAHPSDFLEWKRIVEKILDEPGYRMRLESDIAAQFQTRSWEMFAKEFCTCFISDLEATST
jgi:glycosyltransferase involved in cell wall biosynthesis